MTSVSLSIVIPAHNEQTVLPVTLRCIQDYLATAPFSGEVIVVDDGSTDDTPGLLEQFSREFGALRILRNPRNQGKGASVRRGILASRGEFVLFMDADLPVCVEDISRFLDLLRNGNPVVIASRSIEHGSAPSRLRRLSSILYRRSVRAILGMPLRDTQFGFKAFSGDAIRPIFENLRLGGYSFDVELLFAVWQLGLPIREVEVELVERRNCARHLILLRAPEMLLDLLAVRFQKETEFRVIMTEIAKCLLGFPASRVIGASALRRASDA